MRVGIKSNSTCRTSPDVPTELITLRHCECRFMPTAESAAFTSLTDSTQRRNFRRNSNCSCPSPSKTAATTWLQDSRLKDKCVLVCAEVVKLICNISLKVDVVVFSDYCKKLVFRIQNFSFKKFKYILAEPSFRTIFLKTNTSSTDHVFQRLLYLQHIPQEVLSPPTAPRDDCIGGRAPTAPGPPQKDLFPPRPRPMNCRPR